MLSSAEQTHDYADAAQKSIVLTKAVARAAGNLGLPRNVLARVLGVSPATVTRIYAGDYQLDPGRKEWEFGLLLVRMFRALDALVADAPGARVWLSSENRALQARPIDLIAQTEGLVRVVHYLDASRASV